MNEQDSENATPEAPKERLAINVHEDVTLTERLKTEHFRSGQSKSLSKIDARDDVDRQSGSPTWKEFVFDHENDRYKETVTIKETGETIVKKDERLSEHRGRGSAKAKAAEPE